MAFSSLPRALALCFVAVLVLAACAVSAQPPTDDTHTTLLYHFRTNTTALSNGTVHAWQPSACQAVNGASVKLTSATQPTERNGTLKYLVYIQRFLNSSDCTGKAETLRAADIAASGTLDDVFDNSEVTSFLLFGDDVFDGPFAGLIVLGSIDIETPMSRFAWTLNYNYTYDGQLFLGTVKESLVCTPINNDFSLLWVAEAHVPMSAPSAVLINTSLHYYPGSIDCTGAASHGESDFQSVDDKVGTVTFPFTPRGMRDVLPAGLWVGSTYSLTIGPKPTPPPSNYSSSSSSSSSTGAGPAPESSSTGPAPQPPTPKPTPDFAWGLIFSYSYAGEPYTGPVSESKGDSAVVCTKINNTFSLQWKADAALGGVNNSDVVIANRLSYFPASLDCTGQSARTNNFTVSTDDKDEVYNGTLALMSTEGMPAGLKVYSTYKLAISHPQPPPGPQPDNGGDHNGMSKGTKTLLIALGASAGALILFAGIYCACCKKKPETQHYETAHGNANYQNMA